MCSMNFLVEMFYGFFDIWISKGEVIEDEFTV